MQTFLFDYVSTVATAWKDKQTDGGMNVKGRA